MTKQYFIWMEGSENGGFSYEQLLEKLSQGQINKDSPCRESESKIYTTLGQIVRHQESNQSPASAYPVYPTSRSAPGSSGFIQWAGRLSVFAGVVGAVYFLCLFDTSVSTTVGAVNNFGLVADKLGGIIASVGLSIFGMLVLILDRLSEVTTNK
ncbi:MAG: hypothetical protein JWR69_3052 [Pedosphaera sp.]|nr:hypothetical protein [Pedosphaera sp.]